MKTLNFPITAKRKDLKRLLYLVAIVVGAAVLVAAGYFFVMREQSLPEILSKLPAGMLVFVEKEGQEEVEDEKDILDDWEKLEEKEEKYLEKAEKGEGLTHLARRAMGRYLQENLQNFRVTDEHKVYAEDYIAKQLGSGWLELGQEVEIPIELIEEAMERTAELSQEQLDNLAQYSQLVSF